MVYYARWQENIQQSRQKHTIKHKEEHNTQKDQKVHETGIKHHSLNHSFIHYLHKSIKYQLSYIDSLLVTKRSCERMGPIRKTSAFAYGPLINPPPSLRKISYKYNSMLTYIPVSFLFSVIFRVRVRAKNRVSRLGLE